MSLVQPILSSINDTASELLNAPALSGGLYPDDNVVALTPLFAQVPKTVSTVDRTQTHRAKEAPLVMILLQYSNPLLLFL
jgi:hypothetical protein